MSYSTPPPRPSGSYSDSFNPRSPIETASWVSQAVIDIRRYNSRSKEKPKLLSRLFYFPYIRDYQNPSRRILADVLSSSAIHGYPDLNNFSGLDIEGIKYVPPVIITDVREVFTPITPSSVLLDGSFHYERLGTSPLKISITASIPYEEITDFILQYSEYKKSIQNTSGMWLLGVGLPFAVVSGVPDGFSVTIQAGKPTATLSMALNIVEYYPIGMDLSWDISYAGDRSEKSANGLIAPYKHDVTSEFNVRRPSKLTVSYRKDAIGPGEHFIPGINSMESSTLSKDSNAITGSFFVSDLTISDSSFVDEHRSSMGSLFAVHSHSPFQVSANIVTIKDINHSSDIQSLIWDYMSSQELYEYAYADLTTPLLRVSGIFDPLTLLNSSVNQFSDSLSLTMRVTSLDAGSYESESVAVITPEPVYTPLFPEEPTEVVITQGDLQASLPASEMTEQERIILGRIWRNYLILQFADTNTQGLSYSDWLDVNRATLQQGYMTYLGDSYPKQVPSDLLDSVSLELATEFNQNRPILTDIDTLIEDE